MKVLYILRSTGHYPYHESILSSLHAAGHDITLLFDRTWSSGPFPKTGHLQAGWIKPRADRWRPLLFTCRELRSFASYLRRPDQSIYYLRRWRSYLPLPIRSCMLFPGMRPLLASVFFEELLKKAERRIPLAESITAQVQTLKPDVVVASPVNLRFSEEADYLKSARALGVPTVVPVISWDNLTTKGLFHIQPDVTLVWNQAHVHEAVQIHQLPPDTVIVCGSPFFDKWFDPPKEKRSRSAFCRRVGLDPEKRYLLYLGSSENIAKDETWLLIELQRCMQRRKELSDTVILVRPHPANAKPFVRLDAAIATVWPKEGVLPSDADSVEDFYDSVRFSEAAVGINTSGMIDAVVLDKPTLTILTPEYDLTQSQTSHFQYLLDSDALYTAGGMEACVNTIVMLLKNGDTKHKQRQKFIRTFIRPLGLNRSAGSVAAEAIEMAAGGMRAKDIWKNIR